MASSINASTAGSGGLISTADATGILNIQSAGTTIAALTSTGMAVTGTLSASGVTTFAAGTAALPAITTTGDTDTGIWFPAANTVAASTSGTEAMRIDSSANFKFNSGYGSVATAYGCRAWVTFNGTGTVAISASGNVSSITDNGTGDYTMNFTNAMPDGNYVFVGLSREDNSGSIGDHSVYLQRTEAYSAAGSMRFRSGSTAAATDHIRVMAAIFR
jgi:hypothetical protein